MREYWIVDPDTRSVHVNTLSNGAYIGAVYEGSEAVPVAVLPGCSVDLGEVFAEEIQEENQG